jgi:F0F1-type ATP synthase assembly protein I
VDLVDDCACIYKILTTRCAGSQRTSGVTEPSRDFVDRRWYVVLATLGVEMVAPIGLGIFLDKQLDTVPWLSLAGVACGFFGGMLHLLWTLRAANREGENKPRKQM